LSYLTFEWDNEKYEINVEKHGIRFEEASTVFDDENMLYEIDIEHSGSEERFRAIGISDNSRLLLVCHCVRNGNAVRIISARRATKTERLRYERG
jgi:uncharacterized DUF497 family protein